MEDTIAERRRRQHEAGSGGSKSSFAGWVAGLSRASQSWFVVSLVGPSASLTISLTA